MSTLRNANEAKVLVSEFLTKKLSKQETISQIEHYTEVKTVTETTNLDEHIAGLETWLASDELNTGQFHQSLDTLLLELIELRALFHAFIEVGKENEEFFENELFGTALFQQWKVGSVHIMYSALSKLVSYGSQDKSFIKLWSRIESFMEDEIEKSEFEYICDILKNQDDKRFVNATSGAIRFRNKVIAHNQLSLEPELEILDKDIQELVRVWGLLILFHSRGIILPFRKANIAFSGFSKFLDTRNLRLLRNARQTFLDEIKLWSTTNLVTGELDDKGPFLELKVSLKFE